MKPASLLGLAGLTLALLLPAAPAYASRTDTMYIHPHVLWGICGAVGGNFWSDGNGYGCDKPDCDNKGGICFVVCEAGGGCEGSTPLTGNPRLTIYGILQAGDNVNHHYEPMEGPTGGNTHQPDAPAATPGAAPGGPSFL